MAASGADTKSPRGGTKKAGARQPPELKAKLLKSSKPARTSKPTKATQSTASTKPTQTDKPTKTGQPAQTSATTTFESRAPDPVKPKQKLVRDSFTMPTADFALIGMLKDRMVAFRRPAKKSELLRAGLHALMALPDAKLAAALNELAPLKPGRPRKPV
jgi:hypothetical protein